MAEPAVGCRVRILKEYATVRYVGPVAKQEGTWVGVEWDDATRGKHDGSTSGTRYFSCESSALTAGSFVRIERVNFGVCLLDALRARYNNETAEHGEEAGADELYVHTSRRRRVKVLLVGEEKVQQQQRQIHVLEAARLVGMDVSAVGDAAALAAATPALTSFDLTTNLIASWAFAQQLATALPRLELLNLSDNRLRGFSPLPADGPPPPLLPGIRALVLNDCGLAWKDVLSIAPSLPSLEELHVCGNHLASLQPPPPPLATEAGGAAVEGADGVEAAAQQLAAVFPRLRVLTLEEAGLDGWDSVALLRRLPCLSRLHLAGNPAISHIVYPAPREQQQQQQAQQQQTQQEPSAAGASAAPAATTGAGAAAGATGAAQPGAPFGSLSALFLAGCGVATWGSVDELDRFPALRELRLSGNPVLALSKTGGRFEVIARVSRLTSLNGAEVRPRERRDSELRYLQHAAAEMAGAGADEEARRAVRAGHPRLRALMELHGAVLATAASGGAAGGSLAASTVELKLTCVAAAATAKMGTQVKKLPRSTTVAALRLLCERLFKVPAARMALFLRAPGDPLPEDIGSEEERTLGFFGVADGHEVLVDELDPAAARQAGAAAAEAAAAAHEARLAEQLRAADRLQAEFARSMGLSQASAGAAAAPQVPAGAVGGEAASGGAC